MNNFIVGDIVKSNVSFSKYLTRGKKYVVTCIYDRNISIISDTGIEYTFSKHRFYLDVTAMREKYINEILE